MKSHLNPAFTNEDKARLYLEAQRWPNGAVCPFCNEADHVAPLPPKGSMGPGWYHCADCRKKFTVRVGTLYERSHVPLHKWLYATHLLCSSKKGISAHQLHRMLSVTYKTAWFMAHRIREGMKPTKRGPMGGEGQVIEADETYLGKRDGKPSKPDTFVSGHGWVSYPKIQTQRKIVALVERGGEVRSFHVDRVTSRVLRKILVTNADRASKLHTDEHPGYVKVGKEFAAHYSVNHSEKEYVNQWGVTTNTIEGYFSIFKRGMKGVYQHCSEQHLHRYLAEFDFRYSNRIALGVDDVERTNRALRGIVGKRLTYRRIDEARIA